MITGGFQNRADTFPLLNHTARYAFKSEASISFVVGHGTEAIFKVFGRVDVHHPCDGHFRARLRVWWQPRCLTEPKMNEIIQSLFSALGIPDTETHEALFYEAGYQRFHLVNGAVQAGGTEFIYQT